MIEISAQNTVAFRGERVSWIKMNETIWNSHLLAEILRARLDGIVCQW